MDLAKLLSELGYSDSPHFLRRGTAELRTAPDFGHVFRNASKKPCNLEGVYTLRRTPESRAEPLVPIVYVCHADTDDAASKIHELVWNQDIVPFLLVSSPHGVRLYSGFRCQPCKEGLERGVLKALTQFNKVSELVDSFHADSIDSGQLWKVWGREVTPETRVDWKLLENLQKLDRWLRNIGGLEKEVSHALIGKYVYLHYLRDRKILSPQRLEEWNLDESAIFGRTANRAGLHAVTQRLDEWLNGSVFPLKLKGSSAPDDTLISRVAGTFSGDEIVGDNEWQLHLDFQIYNFSYIPIETLSVIYEQFLHMPEAVGKSTKGEDAAAYYTPIPVVNMMLSEMDERLPLKQGMKVFDPACGSGAFLVQSYRRLIEREFPVTKKKPTPQQLKDLLEGHIFGVDNDLDACRVTELSLVLTLLDYVDPPDLLPYSQRDKNRNFKLPVLSDTNIFHTNFFKLTSPAEMLLLSTQFDWIVGNPPWKDLDPSKLIEQDRPIWEWMSDPQQKKNTPCGDNEVAQAFAWRVSEFLSDSGAVALLLPAMILFEDPSRKFRSLFFSTNQVTAVANFSNLAEVLFTNGPSTIKRPRIPAAAFFYSKWPTIRPQSYDHFVKVFSPMVANQEVTRPRSSGERVSTWSLLITANELRDLPLETLTTGDASPWKFAAWGSISDAKLLARTSSLSLTLGQLEDDNVIEIAEGPALVSTLIKEGVNRTVLLREVVDKFVLNVKALARLRGIFAFPKHSLEINTKHYGHIRRGFRGLSVCRAPHIIVSAARTFAVFTNEYLIVPPRQIGIVCKSSNTAFLKALSLFLSSDFAYYHQFLNSPQFGVKRDIATLNALRSMPVPIAKYTSLQLEPWVDLHTRLVKTTPVDVRDVRKRVRKTHGDLFDEGEGSVALLVAELNKLAYGALGFDDRDVALVDDLVRVRLELIDGKVGQAAVRNAKVEELKDYARRLKSELDAFIDGEVDKWHHVSIVFDHNSCTGMVQIDLIADRATARDIRVLAADNPTADQMEKTWRRLRKERSQWVYFDRNLRLYEGTKTFIFKPLQRLQWTQSQAISDSSEIIAETLQLGVERQ